MNKLCDPPGVSATCVPGCYNGEPNWCSADNIWDCGAWKPTDLKQMLTMQTAAPYTYNEVVIGTTAWLEDPVNAIEAFFYTGEAQANAARAAHATMVEDHPEAASKIPVLRLDLGSDPPFSVPG